MRFLVHVCFEPGRETLPKTCSCQHRISKTERDARFAAGELVILDKYSVAEKRHVRTTRILKRCPSARTISARDIEQAYVCGRDGAARRIEAYGGHA